MGLSIRVSWSFQLFVASESARPPCVVVRKLAGWWDIYLCPPGQAASNIYTVSLIYATFGR